MKNFEKEILLLKTEIEKKEALYNDLNDKNSKEKEDLEEKMSILRN